MADHPPTTLEALRRALADTRRNGSAQLARLAAWALDHPQEMAFHSVRHLARLAAVNPNTVFRLARHLGFSGYDPCRAAFQQALRNNSGLAASRAEWLREASDGELLDAIRTAGQSNFDALFLPETLAKIDQAVSLLSAARRVHCVAVRSCHPVAHLLAYNGGMAFPSFAPVASVPGGIADAVTTTGPEDVVVIVGYSQYSQETVRAHRIATECGARIITMTDSYTSPLAEGAQVLFVPGMEGPQHLPSLLAFFALAEILVAKMVAGSADAVENIAAFERRLQEHGSYMPS